MLHRNNGHSEPGVPRTRTASHGVVLLKCNRSCKSAMLQRPWWHLVATRLVLTEQ